MRAWRKRGPDVEFSELFTEYSDLVKPAAGAADPDRRIGELVRALHAGPRSAQELIQALGISQPTLSRTIQARPGLFTAFRISGDRTPKYAVLRTLPGGLSARQPIYKVSKEGRFDIFSTVEFLLGGATLEQRPGKNLLYEGLPPYMAFAAPSGFLGRQVARAASSLDGQFPENLRDWGDDHHVAYLFTHAQNLSGNLVYGSAALEREMALRKLTPTPAKRKLDHYTQLANQLKDSAHGSSAGGEQPKFLGLASDTGHVIVKFAKRGSRMAQLLPLEHLALRTLAEVGVPAAKTQVLVAPEYVFLEVQRFDRVGRHGRVGMLSAGALDDEFFGARDTWSEFAARCLQARHLSAQDAQRIDIMAAFSELIGNTDRHFENISVLLSDDGEYSGVAPAYDILPMRYASIGGGVDPALTPITPKLSTIGAKPAVWAVAAEAAQRFWAAVQQGQAGLPGRPTSPAFRRLAAENLAVVREFVGPLLPAAAHK